MLNLDKNKKYLLACSFGPDSMALFDMLLKDGYHFSVAHVNYHLRKESNKEEELLRDYCQKHDIEIFVNALTLNDMKGNTENNARIVRYQFFSLLCSKYGFDAVLVAHQQDDLIETYFMQKERKNIVKFYGIQEKCFLFGVNVIRPLLHYSKSDLISYCVKNHIPFAIDSTNLHNDFKRNKIRNEIVSKLDKVERENVLMEISVQNMKLSKTLEKLSYIDLHNISSLLELNEFEFAMAINLLTEKFRFSVSKKACDELKLVLLSKKPNSLIRFKDNVFFEKSYGRVSFIILENSVYSYTIEKPCKFDCEFFFLDFSKGSLNRGVTFDSYPLTIRNIKMNDEYLINGYKVKANRLFIDWKMPLSLRKRWPVIQDKNGNIIYIPHYQKDFKKNESLNFYVK